LLENVNFYFEESKLNY